MKKFFPGLAVLTLSVLSLFTTQTATLQSVTEPDVVSTTMVLSQVNGGGGGSTGTYTYDYVELKNISNSTQSLGGLSLYYGSATGNFASSNGSAFALPNVNVAPGKYFLIQVGGAGTGGAPLPVTPDAVTTNINMSAGSGKIALLPTAFPMNNCGSAATPCTAAQLAQFVDWVAYGAAGNGSAGNGEGGTSVNNGSPLVSSQGAVRSPMTGGCTDTDNNNADFDAVTAPVPRNSSSPGPVCVTGGGTMLFATISANPSTLPPGANTLLAVTVVPATTPPSTGITVTGDLTDIGGLATQPFYDDGTHGDATAGDNVFSFSALVPIGTVGGDHVVTANAADLQGRTVSLQQIITVTGASPAEDPLLFGNPSGATADIANENNYLMVKPQYSLSYNRSKATPNWVAWRLDSSWIGTAQRQDDYRPDPALPPNWYHVGAGSYSGSGYQRGHMCPSGDRTRTVADNSATFLMTNFVPQTGPNNEGPWADFEIYCRTLAQSGSEIYIFSGPVGNAERIDSGRIVVPTITWKVVLILPNGNNDLHRVTRATRVFGIIVPNVPPPIQSTLWRQYRVTVDAVENLTGYNFFNQIPINTQTLIERKRDRL